MPTKLVHNRFFEFPGWHAALEKDIYLAIGPPFWLWKSEICPSQAQEPQTSPKKAGFSTPVPGCGVEHARCNDIVDDARDIVEVARQDNGLCFEACGRNLCNKGIADRPNG